MGDDEVSDDEIARVKVMHFGAAQEEQPVDIHAYPGVGEDQQVDVFGGMEHKSSQPMQPSATNGTALVAAEPVASQPAAQIKSGVLPQARVPAAPPPGFPPGTRVEIKNDETLRWTTAVVMQLGPNFHLVSFPGLDGVARGMVMPFGHPGIRPCGKHRISLIPEGPQADGESDDGDEFTFTIDKCGEKAEECLGLDLEEHSTSLLIVRVNA